LVLDDIAFSTGANSGLWLTDIRISSNFGSSSFVGLSASRTVLSAVSLDVASTPEPGSIAMLLGGLGLLGFARYRIKRS